MKIGISFFNFLCKQFYQTIKLGNTICQNIMNIPLPVKVFGMLIVFLLCYVRFNINLMLFMFLWTVWKAGFFKWLGNKFGEANTKTAIKIIMGAVVFYLIMFWNFKTAPYGDFWFDTDQFAHIIPMQGNARHPLYFLWYWVWALFVPLNTPIDSTSVRYLYIVLASIIAGMFYLFVSIIAKNDKFNKWLTIAFVVSAPMFIHTAIVTDTYLCSSFSVMLCVLYFSYAINNKIHDLCWIISIGILMFGTITTNIAVFVFFYIVLLLSLKITFREKIKFGTKTLAIFILTFTFIALIGNKSPLNIIMEIINEKDSNHFVHMINRGLLFYMDRFFETLFLNFDFKLLPYDSLWAVLLLVPAVFIRRIKTKPILVACYLGFLFYFILFMFFGWQLYLYSPIYNVMAFAIFAHLSQVWNKSELIVVCLVAVLLAVNFIGACNVRNIDRIMRHKSDIEIIEISRAQQGLFFDVRTTKSNFFQQELDEWHQYKNKPRTERILDAFYKCLSERRFR